MNSIKKLIRIELSIVLDSVSGKFKKYWNQKEHNVALQETFSELDAYCYDISKLKEDWFYTSASEKNGKLSFYYGHNCISVRKSSVNHVRNYSVCLNNAIFFIDLVPKDGEVNVSAEEIEEAKNKLVSSMLEELAKIKNKYSEMEKTILNDTSFTMQEVRL